MSNLYVLQGPYELSYNYYKVCKGPKLKDAGIFQFNLEKNNKNEYFGLMNLTTQQQCRIELVSIRDQRSRHGILGRKLMYNHSH